MKKIITRFAVIAFALLLISQNVALAADTGFLSPSSNSADGFGDSWSNASGAYSDGGGSATESDGDRHHYYTFNFNIPAGSTINGIEVKADVWSTDASGCSFGVDLSWNGGSNWSNQKTTSLNSSETTYTFGNSSDSWGGHGWVVDDFTNGNFRARVDSIAPGSCTGTRHLDWIRAKVYYTEPLPTEITSLTLVSVDGLGNGTDIETIEDGDVFNYDVLGTTDLTIRANANPETVGSVLLELTAGPNAPYDKTENALPYSLYGNPSPSTYAPISPILGIGEHTITATPYGEADLGGAEGSSLTRTFKIIQNEAGRCEDAIDNDLDGNIDLDDSDCVVPVSYECSDGIDNDEDGFIDYNEGGDPECSGTEDDNEGPDMCTNVDGDQKSLPFGYYQDGDECYETEGGDAAIMWIYK